MNHSASKRSFAGGRYEVLGELGAGGMGRVLLVRIATTGARAALKTLAPRLAGDPVAMERLRREARAIGALEHPHIVQCFDFGIDEGTPYLVMQFVDGRSLAEIVATEGPLAGPRAARIGQQIASALAVAHRNGILHRDLKPSNVIVSRGYDGGEVAHVIDFGVAAVEAASHERLTRTGQLLGTPNYMAPEQISGGALDPRSDVYGLGALLYGVLAARPPYPGETFDEICKPLLSGDRPPLRVLRPDVGPLAMLVERAMALEPKDRFSSANDFAAALARHAAVPTAVAAADAPRAPQVRAPRKRRPNWVPLASVGAMLGALTALAVGLYPRPNDGGAKSTRRAMTPATPLEIMRPAGARDAGSDASWLASATADAGVAARRTPPNDTPRSDEPGLELRVQVEVWPLPLARNVREEEARSDFTIIRRLVSRNQGEFGRCWLAGGYSSGRWTVTFQIDTGDYGESRGPTTVPSMSGGEERCLSNMLRDNPPRGSYRGRFVLDVELRSRAPHHAR